MKGKKLFGSAVSGKGLALTLCLSAAAIGIAGFLVYRNTAEELKNQLDGQLEGQNTIMQSEPIVTRGKPAVTTPAAEVNAEKSGIPLVTVTEAAVSEAPLQTEAVQAATQPFIRPLIGDTLQEFSGGELVKSKTLNLWQTHDGIDIAGEMGAKVKSMTAGKVTKITADPMWGVTVIIDHGSGIEGHYCNLGEIVNVKLDEKVSAGTVIGTVGDTAECEIAELPHLHFGIKVKGEWKNPTDYFSEIGQ